MELIAAQVNTCDRSAIEVFVHPAHDDTRRGRDGRGSVVLQLTTGGGGPFGGARQGAARAELSGKDTHLLAHYELPISLRRISQLVPEHNPHWPEDVCLEPFALFRTSFDRDLIGVGVHYGHEGGGDGHELSLSMLTWWPAGHEPWPNTGIIALMLPAETRTLIAALERARDRADPAAAEQF